jgi:hypothetical protein
MIKYIIFLVLLVPGSYCNNFRDNNASKITEYDLKLMQEFDTLAYDLSDVDLKSLDIKKIYKFIENHKSYIVDYNLLTVDFKASGGIDDYDYESDRKRDKNYKRVSVNLVYPLYDNKTRKEIKNKKLEYRFKIIDEINKYSKLRDKLISLNRELKFNRLLQIKEKLQVKRAIIYLDDKLKTIEQILKIQNDILDTKSNLISAKLRLLNYVKKQYKVKLEKLLK